MASPQLVEALGAFQQTRLHRRPGTGNLSPTRFVEMANSYADHVDQFAEAIARFQASVSQLLSLKETADEKREELLSDRALCVAYLEGLDAAADGEADQSRIRKMAGKPRQFRAKMLQGMSTIRLADHRMRENLRSIIAEFDRQLALLELPPDPWPPEDRNG